MDEKSRHVSKKKKKNGFQSTSVVEGNATKPFVTFHWHGESK